MQRVMSRDEFIRHKLIQYLEPYVRANFIVAPQEIEHFIAQAKMRTLFLDGYTRSYLERLSDEEMEQPEREARLTEHRHRIVQIAHKIDLIERLCARIRSHYSYDDLVTFRILGTVGVLKAEFEAMEKHIF